MNYEYLSKAKIFLFCCLAFIAGIAIASFLPVKILGLSIYWFLLVIIFAAILISLWQNKAIRLYALIGAFIFFGIWRYGLSIPINSPNKIWFYNGEKIKAIGTIIEEPDAREKNVKYIIKLSAAHPPIFSENKFKAKEKAEASLAAQKVSGKILVTTNLFPEYNYGDKIELNCKLEKPGAFNGFAYDKYLARYDIYSVCYFPEIKLIGKNNGNQIYAKLLMAKVKAQNIINKGMNEPEASLTNAIILGSQRNVPEELKEKFSRTGITHIMAISGMNITIFAALIMNFMLQIGAGRKISFYSVSFFLLAYIMLICFPASAVRAGIMGFLVILAMYIGRLNKIINATVLAAALMLLFNPLILRNDIGFQLSFLAVLGIIYFNPFFEKFSNKFIIKKIFLKNIIKGGYSALAVTVSAQIFTLPILIYNFNSISIISPISNLLILWTQPLFMVASLLAIILGQIFSNATSLFFLPALILIKYVIFISDKLAQIPFASIEAYVWPGWFIFYYLIIAGIVYKIKKGRFNFVLGNRLKNN